MEKRFEKNRPHWLRRSRRGARHLGVRPGRVVLHRRLRHSVRPPPRVCGISKRQPWLQLLRCIISSIGLIRLYDLYQPGRDPWQLIIAQVLVPCIALLSAAQLFITGVRKNLRTAMVRRKFNHTVVCGIGDVGMQVIQNLGGAGQYIVAVDLQDDSPNAATCEKSGGPGAPGRCQEPSGADCRRNPARADGHHLHRIRQRKYGHRSPDQRGF